MKHFYALLTSLVLAMPFMAFGQYGGKAIIPQEDSRETSLRALESPNRAILCGLDTVLYPLFKAADGANPTQVDLFGLIDPGYSRIGQFYPAPDTMIFNGVDFYARNGGIDTADMSIKVYLAGIDSLPTGSPIFNFSFGLLPDTVLRGYSLGLQNPLIVPDDYIITIETTASDSVFIACSEWTIGEGDGEWLANAGAAAFWQRGYDVFIDGDRFDGDVLLMPHVAYIVDLDQTVTPDCIEPGNEISFNSSISSFFFSPVYNRFYNPYSSFYSPDSNFTWYFGDGDSSFLANPKHTYNFTAPLPDSIEVQLIGLHLGYSFLCPDGEAFKYEVQPAPDASFTVDDSTKADTFIFSFTGSGSNLVWDFGDGSPQVNGDSMPSHSYADFGDYTVTLFATGCSATDSRTFQVSYRDASSIRAEALTDWNVYPNPTSGELHIMPKASFGQVRLQLLNAQGQVVASREIQALADNVLDWNVDFLPAGMYWLEIQRENQRQGTRVMVR